MKFFALFAIVATLAASQAFTVEKLQPRGLDQDFQDFLELVPLEDIIKVALDYLTNDKEFQQAFAYLQSKDFAKVWEGVFKLKDVKDCLKFLQNAGLDVYDLLNQLGGLLNLPPVKPTFARRGTGLDGFLNDVLALLPKDKLVALFKEKLQTSPEFKAFVDKVTSPEFEKLGKAVLNNPEFKTYLKELKEHGFDLVKFFEVVKTFFGFN
uniref:Putative microvillar protein with insect allergen related repeat n=1 Tax=Nyssomyia neivai TaxID=330878 RepID=A0A1L8DRE9_9DIPT